MSAPPNTLTELSAQMARAASIGGQSVVAVHGRPHVPSSGVLWRDGVVLTTDHTLKRNDDITVTLPDGTSRPTTLLGRDGGTDLAVLRLEGGETVAAPKPAGEASIETGNFVLALGRRGEDGISASFGVVNAVSGAWRTWRGGQIESFIRPDVNIYVGFSGGALVDVEGRVIGLNTSGLTRGSGVTIPAATLNRVTDEILATGRVRRGYIGVGLHPVELPDGRAGLVILSTEPGGPAATAGILVGDVLLNLDGHAIHAVGQVQAYLSSNKVGRPIVAELLRGGTPLSVTVIAAERPEAARS